MLKYKLSELREKVIYESSLVEKMLKLAVEGLLELDSIKLEQAFDYENQINTLELEIEEMCISLIALYQPEAKDLRTIVMILKMNSDLERMGDMGVNIIGSAQFLIERPQLKQLISLPNMAKETINMMNDAMKSFVTDDVDLAKKVCVFDDVIDAYNEQIARELLTYMLADAKNIERSMHLMRISQNLERIADLCTNIAEETVFIKEGRVIKHHQNK
jgi:phosphate transport system protein